MQTSITKSNFIKKNNTDMMRLAFGAFAIVVFLSAAFLRFDATSLPPSNSTIGEPHPPAVMQPMKKSPAPSQGEIAETSSPTKKAPFQFVSTAQENFVYSDLNATAALDKETWRYTTDGWRDISMMNNQPQFPKPILENVHPAIWTAMLFLSSLLLLVMACSDQDIKRLLSRNKENSD